MNVTPSRRGRAPNPGMLRGGKRSRSSVFGNIVYNAFRGPAKRKQAGRSFNQSLDIGVVKNRYNRNAKSFISTALAIHMKDQAPLIWVSESRNQYDFDSPNQGVYAGVSATQNDIGVALLKSLRTGSRGNLNGVGTYTALSGFGGIGESALPTGLNLVGTDGAGSLLNDIKFVVHYVRECHQIVNSSTNPIEFIFQFWSNRYDVSRYVPTSGALSDQAADGWMPVDMQQALTAIGLTSVNQNAIGDGAISGYAPSPPQRFGQSLGAYTMIKDHFKNVGTIKFVLKPGEQKNIYSSVRGPHVMNMNKFQNYKSYRPLTSNWSIIARAGIVGDSLGQTVSHGSGQFQIYKKFEIKCQFAQRSLATVKVMETAAATAIITANQERINAETDRQHLYSEL